MPSRLIQVLAREEYYPNPKLPNPKFPNPNPNPHSGGLKRVPNCFLGTLEQM